MCDIFAVVFSADYFCTKHRILWDDVLSDYGYYIKKQISMLSYIYKDNSVYKDFRYFVPKRLLFYNIYTAVCFKTFNIIHFKETISLQHQQNNETVINIL